MVSNKIYGQLCSVDNFPCPPATASIIELDKVEYSPGDIVTIRVAFGSSNQTAFLVIADATEDIQGNKIIDQQSKQLVNGQTEFEYTIPASSSTYRYLVKVYETTITEPAVALFFSETNASKIVLSDLRVLNPEVRAGENLDFELTVTDAIGNPIPYSTVSPSVNYISCEGHGTLSGETSIDDSTGMVKGSVAIPDGMPGTYELTITASVLVHGVAVGFSPVQTKVQFHVISDNANKLVNIESHDIMDRGFLDLKVGDRLDVTGFVNVECKGQEIAIPLEIKLIHMKMNFDEVRKQLQTDRITYDSMLSCGTNPSVCRELRDIDDIAQSTSADPSYRFSLQLTELIPGEYVVVIIAGFDETNSFGIRLHNIKDYTVTAEGKDFLVVVDSWYNRIEKFEFHQQDKKVLVVVNASKEPRTVDIKIPHELLDGDFTVLINDKEQDATEFFLRRNSTHAHFTLFPNVDESRIEIIGTTVIPEFPVNLMITAAIGLIGVLISLRLKGNAVVL